MCNINNTIIIQGKQSYKTKILNKILATTTKISQQFRGIIHYDQVQFNPRYVIMSPC